MSEALLSRLESAIARLEKLELSLNSKSSSSDSSSKSTSSSDVDIPSKLQDAIDAYDKYFNEFVTPFVDTCKKYPDLVQTSDYAYKAFKNQGDLIKACGVSKKASDAEVLAFLKPAADAIEASGKMNFKSAQYTHLQAFNASISIVSWPFCPPCATYAEGMLDSATMYLNRILTKANDHTDASLKELDRTFVKTYKAMLSNLVEFIRTYFKAGLEWNPKGKSLSEYNSSSSSSSSSSSTPAPAAKPTPEPVATSSKPAGGMASVFGQLNQGLNITSGLKKVTDDMKSKNRTDAPIPVKTAPTTTAPKPVVAAPVKKPAVLEKKNTTWYCEYQENNTTPIEIKDVAVQENVYIGKCRNASIIVTGKPKAIALDGCFRVTIQIPDILSSVELVNCERCTLYFTGIVPTIAVDKSKGIVLNLNAVALAANPDIFTSSISECNIQIPGKDEEEYIYEMAIPEQFLTKVNGRSLNTNHVTHG